MHVVILKKKLLALANELNSKIEHGKIQFTQHPVPNSHRMSFAGLNGRMWFYSGVSFGYDVSLSGISIEKQLYPALESLFGRGCDGYKHKGRKTEPYWRTDDFSLVKKAGEIYSQRN